MISEEDRTMKTCTPVCLAFHDEEQVKTLLTLKSIFIDGTMCTVRPYMTANP